MRVHRLVITFVNNLKLRLKAKHAKKYQHKETLQKKSNFITIAIQKILQDEQKVEFSEIINYFKQKNLNYENCTGSSKPIQSVPRSLWNNNTDQEITGTSSSKSKTFPHLVKSDLPIRTISPW